MSSSSTIERRVGIADLEYEGAIEIGRGKVISKKDLAAAPGYHPVYSSAKENDGKFGEYGHYMFDEELITWSVDGGGRLFHRRRHKFSITNVGGFIKVTDHSRVHCRYLYYALSYLHGLTTFDWVKKAHPSVIRKIYTDIRLPELREQQRIVAVLDQAFAALDRASANVEANKQDAFELFDNTLLATFEEILESSRVLTLNQAAKDFSRGKSKYRPRNDPSLYEGEYPFIQTGDVRRSNGVIREHSQSYNEKGLAQSKLWPAGTVCITIAANIAETGVLDFAGCFPDSVIGMVPNSEITGPYYVEYMLRFFAKELKLQGKGSAQDNINLATFERAKFPFPDLTMQGAIVEKLDQIAAVTFDIQSKFAKELADISDLRQSLLEKAYSGKLV